MAEWLTSRTMFQQPQVLQVWLLGANMAPLVKPCCGGVPRTTTRGTHNWNIQLCTAGLWGEEEEEKNLITSAKALRQDYAWHVWLKPSE